MNATSGRPDTNSGSEAAIQAGHDASGASVARRRARQLAYNAEHGITPTTIKKEIKDITDQLRTMHQETVDTLLSIDRDLFEKNPKKLLKEKMRQMDEAVKILDFETAAILRDEIRALEELGGKKKGKKS